MKSFKRRIKISSKSAMPGLAVRALPRRAKEFAKVHGLGPLAYLASLDRLLGHTMMEGIHSMPRLKAAVRGKPFRLANAWEVLRSMRRARLILCEKSGRWAVAWRRELGQGTRVYETRSLLECQEELAKSPASWLVLETSEKNVERVRDLIARLGVEFPEARALVCGDRQMADWESVLREAGAVFAVYSPRDLSPAARLAARHLALAKDPPRALRERIWERLPWGDSS